MRRLYARWSTLTGSGVLQLEVLILELVAIDRLASSSVSGGKVATLTKKNN